jgi:hypothetical protein
MKRRTGLHSTTVVFAPVKKTYYCTDALADACCGALLSVNAPGASASTSDDVGAPRFLVDWRAIIERFLNQS